MQQLAGLIAMSAETLTRLKFWVVKRFDLLCILLAIIYSLPSLGYPFGRDQAAHYYIGREWLNGLLPFRDAFDQKPPGIYLVHALSIILFGARQWAIRIMDLAALLVIGFTAWRAVRRSTPRVPGELGLLILFAAGFYYTTFDFWDTGQVETWEGLTLIAGYAVGVSSIRSWLRAVLSGALAGMAVIFKMPAAVVAVPIALAVACYAWGNAREQRIQCALQALCLYASGVLMVSGVCALYFALQGGLSDMIEVLFGYNVYYALHKPTPLAMGNEWARSFWFDHCDVWVVLTLVLWSAGIAGAAKRRDWHLVRGAVTALLLCICAAATVWIQHKFYSYHWVVVAPFLILCAGYGIVEGLRTYPRITAVVVIMGILLGIDTAPPWITNNKVTYGSVTSSFWKYVCGYQGRTAYLEKFTGGYGYNYLQQEYMGETIRGRAQPGDQVIVRGFEPAIYAVSGLRCPSRFFADFPLTDPLVKNYNTTTWPAEHERACWTDPPRFVVSFTRNSRDVKAIIDRGYYKAAYAGRFVLLQRTTQQDVVQ